VSNYNGERGVKGLNALPGSRIASKAPVFISVTW
jgi:hypothetical protein